ncbi:MAG: hypothetical protein DRN91_06280 [Candidatus Alkanophagales archaeon]|nr:MAG: hypothetical protein DRN91_06280 [Candidatus Alkanophagales archaeon]
MHSAQDGSAMKEEHKYLLIIAVVFALVIGGILSVPYDPQADIVDAVSIDTWAHLYIDGIYKMPLYEFLEKYPRALQSGVIEEDGEYYVVTEKGIGYVLFYALMIALGIQRFTGTILALIAVVSTYILSRRLFGVRCAALSTILLLTTGIAMIMTYRYAWVDYGTMAFLVLSICLFIEGVARKSSVLCLLSGSVFSVAVSTRYPVGLLVVLPFVYLLVKEAPRMKLIVAFCIGLLILLTPLLWYNTITYGGPFKSGYDVRRLGDFVRGEHEIELGEGEGASKYWSIEGAVDNLTDVPQMFLIAMPVFYLAFFGLYRSYKDNKAGFYLLFSWITLTMILYFPMGHLGGVGLQALQQVRYFLPMLPALCIFGANALSGLFSKGKYGGILVAALLIILAGVGVSATIWNMHTWDATGRFKEIDVDLKSLYENPSAFNNGIVTLRHLIVIKYVRGGLIVKDSTTFEDMLLCFPRPPPQSVKELDRITGKFIWKDRNQNGSMERGEGVIMVKEIRWVLP